MGRDDRRLGNRVTTSAVLLVLVKLVTRATSFILIMILARILAPEAFGIVALAAVVMGAIETVSNIQVGNALIRLTDVTKKHLDTAFTIGVLRGAASALLLLAIAKPVATVMETPELEQILMVLAIPAFISGLSNPHFALYWRNLDFRLEAIRHSVASVASAVVAISIALVFRSYWALVASMVVYTLVVTLLTWWRVGGRPGLSLACFSELFGFGSWLVLHRLFTYLGNRAEYFIIGRAFDANLLGAYHVANQTIQVQSQGLVHSLSRAAFPALSMLQDRPERLRASYVQFQSTTLAVAFPLGVGTAVLAAPIIRVLFGPGWDAAIPVLQIAAPANALLAMGAGTEAVAMALNRVRMLALRSGIYQTFRLGLLIGGLLLGGFLGLLAGRALGSLGLTLFNIFLAARWTGGSMLDPLLAGWRSLVASGAMAAGLLLLPAAPTAAASVLPVLAWLTGAVALGILIYAGVHLVLWQLCGRPDGAETRIIGETRRLSGKLGRRLRRDWRPS